MSNAILGAWNPDLGSYNLRVRFNSVTEDLVLDVSTDTNYYLSGDGAGNDLLAILETLFDTHSEVANCSLVRTGSTIGINLPNSSLQILWSDVATTFPSWILGFDSSDATFLSASASPLIWIPQRKQSFDTRNTQNLVIGRDVSLDGKVYTTRWTTSARTRDIQLNYVLQRYIKDEYASVADTTFEAIDRRSLSLGGQFRFYEEASSISLGTGFDIYRLRDTPILGPSGPSAPKKWNLEFKMVVDS